jgi:hypothetical protein
MGALLTVLGTLLIVFWSFFVVAGMVLVEFLTIVSTIRDPSFARWFSILVALYVVSLGLGCIAFSTMSGTGNWGQRRPKSDTILLTEIEEQQ